MATAKQLNVTTDASAMDMAQTIFGAGIVVVDASFQGDPEQSGIYVEALDSLAGISPTDSGVILSTGRVANFAPYSDDSEDTNRDTATSTYWEENGVHGDPDLDGLAGSATYDSAILTATFIPEGDWITLQFVFSSEEYLEYVNDNYNDVFGVWVNGVFAPVSVLEGGVASINTVNPGFNGNLYLDNPQDQDPFNTEMDGLTRVLTVKAPVNAGVPNTIKLAIADHGDDQLDSNVLIMAGSIQSHTIAFDDALSLEPDSVRVLDVLHNDRNVDGGQLIITHINGEAVSPGDSVTLPSGEVITLNPDWTLTIAAGSEIGTDPFTYTVQNAQGITDLGVVTLSRVADPVPDGIVQGTSAAELIDLDYLGDLDGDRIDAGDAIGVGGTTGDGDYVLALDGDDTVVAGAGDDIVYGGAGDDVLHGNAGDDRLLGDAGDDVIYGGAGNDTMYGGADADRFKLAAGFGADTVFGGETVTDGSDFDMLDATALDADISVIFSGDEAGVLTDGANTVAFHEIEVIALGGGDDTVDAAVSSMAQVLDGGAGNDLLIGGRGDDTLIAGTGADTLAGGQGDDLLILGGADGAQDVVQLADGGGMDTVQGFEAPVDNGDGSFTAGDLLDVTGLLDGSGEPVNVLDVAVVVDAGDTILTFPDGTTVTLAGVTAPAADQQAWLTAIGIPAAPVVAPAGPVDGTAGDDLIIAGYVDGDGDQIDGTDGLDDTVYGNAGDDLIRSGAGDDLVYGGSGNDRIEAEEGQNTLHGDAGADVIRSGSGNDLIYGGDDADRIEIGDNAGDDTVHGGEGGLDADTLVSSAGDADVLVEFTGDEAGTLVRTGTTVSFSEIEAIELGGGDDTVDASAAASAVTVSGGAGDDLIIGGAGADRFYGGAGNDVLDGGAGDDLLSGGDGDDFFILRDGFGQDTIIGGEDGETLGDALDATGVTGNVTLTLTGNETGTLTAGGNALQFSEIEGIQLGAGNDLIDARSTDIGAAYDAGGGDDTLLGGSGDDTLSAGIGADRVAGGAGNDLIDLGATQPGGDGAADTVVLADGGGHDVIRNFEAPVADGSGGWTGVDLLDVSGLTDADGEPVNVDDVTLSDTVGDGSGDAILTFPDGSAVTLQGVPLAAVSSAEQLVALGIPAAPVGPALNFIVTGTAAGDLIDADYLDDPEGDRIDASDASDGSQDDLVFALDGDDTVLAGAGNDTAYGGLGDDQIHGGIGDDVLYGDAGDDTLLGGAGNDTLFGGVGNDVFVITDSEGDDELVGGEDDLGGDLDLLQAGAVTQDMTVTFADAESGTIALGGNVIRFSEIERFELGTGNDTVSAFGDRGAIEIAGGAGNDELTVSAAELRAADVDLDDDLHGTFTPAEGGAPVAFGPTEALRLSDVLNRSGTIRLLGDGSFNGRVGDVTFSDFETVSFNIVCFVRGTRIKTDRGEIAIEALAAGDRVLTLDSGFQPIRWIGSTTRPARGRLAPIRIAAGVLGNDRDLLVSPQHRMLLRGWQASLLFGSTEVLVTAKSLVNDHSIRREEGGEVAYFHLLFDRHEIIFAEGAPSESFHPGVEGWKALDDDTRDEILDLFPELASEGLNAYGEAARPALRDYEGRVLAKAIFAVA